MQQDDRRISAGERIEQLNRRYWLYLLLAEFLGSFIGMLLAGLAATGSLESAVVGGLMFIALDVAITLATRRSIGGIYWGVGAKPPGEPGNIKRTLGFLLAVVLIVLGLYAAVSVQAAAAVGLFSFGLLIIFGILSMTLKKYERPLRLLMLAMLLPPLFAQALQVTNIYFKLVLMATGIIWAAVLLLVAYGMFIKKGPVFGAVNGNVTKK